MQLGGEGGSGLLAHLDGLLAGPGRDHDGRHHQHPAEPAEEVVPNARKLNIIVSLAIILQ